MLARQIAVTLAEIYARLRDADAALGVLDAHPPARLGLTGIAAIIDREVISASALERAGQREAAIARLEPLTSLGLSTGPELSGSVVGPQSVSPALTVGRISSLGAWRSSAVS